MKSIIAVLCTVTLATAASSSAKPALPVEQAYFEVVVSKGKDIVSQPHTLVRLGVDARINFKSSASDGAYLALEYRVEPLPESTFSATVTALVAGKRVATRTVSFTETDGASTILEGGGYSWKVTVDYMTPEFLKRRKAQKAAE